MPELPEVHTTASMLHKLIRGKVIVGIWSNYDSSHYIGKENIKDTSYLKKIRSDILDKKIIKIDRRAKNILIHLEDTSVILIHMKMTGHLLYGRYSYNKNKNVWTANEPGYLQDPFNQFIHFVLTFSDGTNLALSDMRKFATVSHIKTQEELIKKFKPFGPEPLNKNFDWKKLKLCLFKKSKQKLKTILMDQNIISGIGNIYSDEILWMSHLHPERTVLSLKDVDYRNLTKNSKNILSKGIDFGGDSMSDYRNPNGEPGKFQLHHKAYRRTGQNCKRKNCTGTIQRKVIGGRSAHFCNVYQK